MDPAMRDALQERMRFYRELGLTEFYRRPVDEALLPVLERADVAGAAVSSINASAQEDLNPVEENSPIPPRKPIYAAPPALNEIPAKDRAAALQLIRDDIGDCTRCALHKGRNKIVFADGSPEARLLSVGEGPGADEDAQGLPFVGRAGQLLNNMISAMGLKREDVYIANVVKCRPPGNRTPEPEEANTCSPFLFKQSDVVRPEVIVALGATAATYLLGAAAAGGTSRKSARCAGRS